MKISILCPTRGRPHNVRRLLASLGDTSEDRCQLEVVLFLDDDDAPSHGITSSQIQVRSIIAPRRPTGDMFRACFSDCSGTLVMLAGDDVVFRTFGWDSAVRAAAQEWPDPVGLIYTNDLLKGAELCTHPILTRAAAEVLGRPCSSEYPGEYIDTHIFDVFTRLRRLGADRIRYLGDVVIEHMHHSVGKAPFDDTYANSAPSKVCKAIFEDLAQRRDREAHSLWSLVHRERP